METKLPLEIFKVPLAITHLRKGLSEQGVYNKSPISLKAYKKIVRILDECSGKEGKCSKCHYKKECLKSFFKLVDKIKDYKEEK